MIPKTFVHGASLPLLDPSFATTRFKPVLNTCLFCTSYNLLSNQTIFLVPAIPSQQYCTCFSSFHDRDGVHYGQLDRVRNAPLLRRGGEVPRMGDLLVSDIRALNVETVLLTAMLRF